MNEIRVASFFAGAGGLDLGFKNAGFEIVYASDIDGDCCETLKMNRGTSTSKKSEIHCGDIRQIDFDRLPKNIDLVVGGPPCQSFSASGRRAGGAAGRLDDRGNLFEAYRDIIRHLSPKAFVFENVRGILATNKGQDWSAIVEAFNELGYNVDFRLLDAADYGVPQHRERMFLVGHCMKKPFLFPRPIFGPDSESAKAHIAPNQAFKGLRMMNSEAEGLRFEGGKYSHLLPEVPEGQNYLFFTSKRGHPNPVFAYRSRFSDFLYKADRTAPMKTIIASPGKYTGPLHWDNRYFSIGEYKAIQGFPQAYKFYGERASIIKQIGNSVSPRIAEVLAKCLANQIFGAEFDLPYLDKDEALTFDKRKGVKAAKTRLMHQKVSRTASTNVLIASDSRDYSFIVAPTKRATSDIPNVVGNAAGGRHHLSVHYVPNAKKAACLKLDIWPSARDFSGEPTATLTIDLHGYGRFAPQLIWNAVDEWVRSVSSFQSLFELYGHFTEPYPFFQVSEFDVLVSDPILEFAKFVSNFERCSKYLDKSDLLEELGEAFNAMDFDELATKLRDMRYDVRTRETNIAIPNGKYMIAYPFTLPQSKQMNFSVKRPRTERSADSYVTEKRAAH